MRELATSMGADAAQKYLETVRGYFNDKSKDDNHMYFGDCRTIKGEDEAMGAWYDAQKSFPSKDGKEVGIIEMGGSSVQIKCKRDTFVSFANYGANDGLEEICKSSKNGKTPETLKCSDFTYHDVKTLFWSFSDAWDPFVELGLVDQKYGWNNKFKSEIMAGKQAFRLASTFMYNAKRYGVPEDGDYFAKCRELVDGNKLTEKLIPDDKFSTKASI